MSFAVRRRASMSVISGAERFRERNVVIFTMPDVGHGTSLILKDTLDGGKHLFTVSTPKGRKLFLAE